jgi:hypothetical protein
VTGDRGKDSFAAETFSFLPLGGGLCRLRLDPSKHEC